MEVREYIRVEERDLARGYRHCNQLVKRDLADFSWMLANLPSESRQGCEALLAHLLNTLDLLDLDSPHGLSLDVWQELMADLSDAFLGKYTRLDLAALADTCQRFSVPRQFVFDPMRGADLWIRNRRFETFAELETFCSYVGGASLAALVPVMGVVRSDYELPAIACGKYVMLMQVLTHCVNDLKHNRVFFPEQDLRECEVDLSRVRLRQSQPGFRHLVRACLDRMQPLQEQAVELIPCLDFDGRRSVTALLSLHWHLGNRLRRDPELALKPTGVLKAREVLRRRSRFMLGLEAAPPFAVEQSESGH